jgi:hypothetical protein
MENISNISSEEELLQLRNDGKISEAEYQELLAAIRKSPAKETTETVRAETFFSLRDVPWQIWVVVVLLALEGIGNLQSIPQQPRALFWLGAKCLFIIGLLKRWRWVFCLFVIICIIHVLFFLTQAPIAVLMNLALVALVLSAYRFYFPSQAEYNYLIKVKEKLLGLSIDNRTDQSNVQDPKHKQGKIAIYLMSAGFIFPIVVFFISYVVSTHFGLGEMDVVMAVCFALCVLLEIPAFVLGVISWPDSLGKATVTTISVLTGILILFLSFAGDGNL